MSIENAACFSPGLRSLFQSSLLPGLKQAAFSMLYLVLLQLSLPWQGTCYLNQPVFELCRKMGKKEGDAALQEIYDF